VVGKKNLWQGNKKRAERRVLSGSIFTEEKARIRSEENAGGWMVYPVERSIGGDLVVEA